jgi:hypothetical protein
VRRPSGAVPWIPAFAGMTEKGAFCFMSAPGARGYWVSWAHAMRPYIAQGACRGAKPLCVCYDPPLLKGD